MIQKNRCKIQIGEKSKGKRNHNQKNPLTERLATYHNGCIFAHLDVPEEGCCLAHPLEEGTLVLITDG